MNTTEARVTSVISSVSVGAPSTTDSPSAPPPALATSKRKFHRLLESITRPSKHSIDGSNASTDRVSAAKRIRLEAYSRLEAQSCSVETGAPGTSGQHAHARVQTDLLRVRLEAAKLRPIGSLGDDFAKSSRVEPNFNPWSHTGFLRRLQTFADIKRWTSKPKAVNEVQWAKKGWVCVDFNTVVCRGGCEQRFVVALWPSRKAADGDEIACSEDHDVEVSNELIRRISLMTADAHADGCLWKANGCADDIYRLPIARQAVWQPELQARYVSFMRTPLVLPSMNNVRPKDTLISISLLPPGFFEPIEPINTAVPSPTNVNHVAFALALLGWTASPESTSTHPIATCNACFRRLGLWLYAEPQTNDDDHQASKQCSPSNDLPKADAIPQQMTLDLLANHRPYCPWINDKSQYMNATSSLAGLAGWQVLQRCIENSAAFRAAGDEHNNASPGMTRLTDTSSLENPDPHLIREEIRSCVVADTTSPRAPRNYLDMSPEQLEHADRARFAKLRELSRSIGLTGLRAKLSRARYM